MKNNCKITDEEVEHEKITSGRNSVTKNCKYYYASTSQDFLQLSPAT